MVFSSPVFLFLFLPFTLLLYGVAAKTGSIRVKNGVLLFCSVCFYGYGGLSYLGLLFLSVLVNWIVGIMLERQEDGGRRKLVFIAGIVWNVGILVVFKYLNLLGDSAAWLIGTVTGGQVESVIPNIVLPIGISFFTFQIT